MKILSLDISSRTGWAIMNQDCKLLEYGLLEEKIQDYNHKDPTLAKTYPFNFVEAANKMASKIIQLINEKKPDKVVIENTVKSRNRNSQRYLEFLHKAVLDWFMDKRDMMFYVDPSAWRKELGIRLSKEDKKNNSLVSKGKKRGRVGKKHLALRFVLNEYGLKLKVKQNNEADSIALAACGIRILNKRIDINTDS